VTFLEQDKIKELAAVITNIKQELNRLLVLGGEINCVERNITRIIAGIKMLELNINDVAELIEEEKNDLYFQNIKNI